MLFNKLVNLKRTIHVNYIFKNIRNFSNNLPNHLVVAMPALSPTMETGTISKWLCVIGDEISAGKAIAEIETDKASMTFEAQDDFFIAKLLVEQGQEVKVGDPIFISVEDKSFITAFSSYSTPTSVSATPVIPPPVVSLPVETKPTLVVPITPSPVVPVLETPKVVIPPPVKTQQPVVVNKDVKKTNLIWGKSIQSSPLSNRLRKEQSAYIEKYGRSGHKAI